MPPQDCRLYDTGVQNHKKTETVDKGFREKGMRCAGEIGYSTGRSLLNAPQRVRMARPASVWPVDDAR
eukprot:6206768-Pleurochrysis_carterae.AAC.2